jgi:formylglycine-generating enzyme required for sulfatase activity
VPIPTGEFTMGSPENDHLREPDEQQHEVEITTLFYMGVYEATQRGANN